MNNLFTLSYGVILGSVLLLVGCGGGGGGGGNKPSPVVVSSVAISSAVASSLTPSSLSISSSLLSSSSIISTASLSTTSSSSSSIIAATSSISSSPSIAPSSSSSSAMTRLTIQGKVGADALVGGTIRFTIGDQDITGNIDSSKSYSIELDLSSLNQELPLYSYATGAGGKRWVELAAYLPSISELKILAGNDSLLESSEYEGVNITYLSTAEFAEIISSRAAINNDTDLKNAIFNLDPVRTLEQAAMISRLINDPNVKLPVFKSSILSYAFDTVNADGYLEILRIKDKSSLVGEIEKIKADPHQSSVSSAAFVGRYFLETKTAQYQIQLNADGTGFIKTGQFDSELRSVQSPGLVDKSIKWHRKAEVITIELADSFNYQIYSLNIAADGKQYICDNSSTVDFEVCNISVKSIQLTLISQPQFRTYASAQLNIELTKSTDSTLVYRGALRAGVARMLNLDESPKISANSIIGSEWIAKKFSYVFSDDGKVIRTNLLTNAKTTKNWRLTNNRIQMDDSALQILSEEISGLAVLFSDGSDIYRTSLVKRTQLLMREGWWVGRWTTYRRGFPASSYDVHLDRKWNDGYESGLKGSWEPIDDLRQKAISNGSWRMIRDALALHDGKYYLSVCQGIEAEPFVPIDCYLSVETVNREFLGGVFWNEWSKPFFNHAITGGIWSFLYGKVIGSNTPEGSIFSSGYVKVSDNMLYNRITDTVIELIEPLKSTIKLCEYKSTDSCDIYTVQPYILGVEVGLTVSSGGSVERQFTVYDTDEQRIEIDSTVVDKVFMLPQKRAVTLVLKPSQGFTVDSSSVSGCNGVLSGMNYKIPALTQNCDIVVNFVKNP